MTSRLKRKLGEIGVDTSSRKANENFCLIGTPLPPLEKSKDTGEFVPLWKQEVRDEKGRKRLHGAFTGGWSAGYFNTVGSKEGWTPATFISSRSDRAKKQAARPEDFMDEEDLQDLKDGRKIVDETEQMDFHGGTRESRDDVEDPMARTLEASFLPPPKDSVGAKILKKMGWRLGQGIGPRISLKRRKEQDAQAYDPLTGNRVTTGNLDIQEDDEEANKHTYANRDIPVLSTKRKDNSHGLGYVPGMTLQESLGNDNARGSSGPRLAGGFGLGALNDADEDDLDVYDSVQQTSRRRAAFDLTDGDNDDTIIIGNTTGKGKETTSNPSKPYFRDGRPVLRGFVLSSEPVAEDIWFPLPEIPPGWQPNPRSVMGKDLDNAATTSSSKKTNEKWRSHLSASQRGTMLGEVPLPSGPKSVFDYMSEKDKERIQKIASGLASGIHPSAPTSRSNHIDGFSSSPPTRLDPSIAQAALKGFQPFPSDPVKQGRYTTYLQSQASADGSAPPLQPLSGQKPDEFTKEMEDYAKAASLFKPMSGTMAGRFTSAATLDMGPQVIEGLYQPSQAELEASERRKEEEEEQKVNADPKVHAAKMGMYGPLTREVKPWVPAKLLCKRFGVKEPDVSMDALKDPAQQSQTSFTQPEFTAPSVSSSSAPASGQRSDGPRDITNIGLGEDETQGQDVLTYQRPSMDIFKAIFASDDEDEGNEDDKDVQDEQIDVEDDNAERKGFMKATVIFDDTPVDPETFKPTFMPRDNKGKTEKNEKKQKKKKDKDKKSVLVSFEMDGDGHPERDEEAKDRPNKKRRKDIGDKKKGSVGVRAMDIDNGLHIVTTPNSSLQDASVPNKNRKRAVDFMD